MNVLFAHCFSITSHTPLLSRRSSLAAIDALNKNRTQINTHIYTFESVSRARSPLAAGVSVFVYKLHSIGRRCFCFCLRCIPLAAGGFGFVYGAFALPQVFFFTDRTAWSLEASMVDGAAAGVAISGMVEQRFPEWARMRPE